MVRKWRNYKLVILIILAILLLTNPLWFADHHCTINPSEMLATSLINRSEHLDQIYTNTSIPHMLPVCEYEMLIKENRRYHDSKILLPTLYMPDEILNGGEYYPKDCQARYSVAIIVPYRNRETQINHFINYMHNFLRIQNIHYKIIVVEQIDDGPFNKGMLLNYGAAHAIKEKFPCLILHDIDSLPTSLGNLYVCNKNPRHFAASVDKFRFHLPYVTFFGVVGAVDSQAYVQVNGFSNRFKGWGREDDDFYMRLYMGRFLVVRFERKYSEYVTLYHKQAKPAPNRHYKFFVEFSNYKRDGFNTLSSTSIHLATIEYKRYTYIMVRDKE